jgi:hypothetical protein
MGIRPLFIILILLLNAVVARGDKPTVIKDSEAIHYVGKEVDVHGWVVSVTTSPMRTAFINFGGDYLNQNFAGYIATGEPSVCSGSHSPTVGRLFAGKRAVTSIKAYWGGFPAATQAFMFGSAHGFEVTE